MVLVGDLKNKTNKQQGKTPADSNKTAGLGASYLVTKVVLMMGLAITSV